MDKLLTKRVDRSPANARGKAAEKLPTNVFEMSLDYAKVDVSLEKGNDNVR